MSICYENDARLEISVDDLHTYIYKLNSMLKVVATRATRMPVSPAAWSSSSRTIIGGFGGVGGGVGGGKALA